MTVDELRRAAAERAVEQVESGMVVGLGVGRAATFALRCIAERLRDGSLRDILGVPCSISTATDARRLGISLTTLDEHPVLDLTIDGADEVDAQLNLIKGGGGALLREKIVAQASRREIIIVEEGKLSEVLGSTWAVPVEVVPFGLGATVRYLESIGGRPFLRHDADGARFQTDQGNHILDCHFGPLPHPEEVAALLKRRAGIVEHGLFLGLATEVIVAGAHGIRVLTRAGTSEHAPQVSIFPNLDSLSRAAAWDVQRLAREAVAARGRFLLALSGGSTPRRLYEILATERGDSMPWPQVHLVWGDERCVPPDHPHSNYAMAKAALIDRVPIPAENIHRIPAEMELVEAAAAYERELQTVSGGDRWPVLDLALLGMGADGHTASLFPGGPELAETERASVAVTAPPAYDPRRRVSLTLPVLNRARAVLFLVAGADKRPVLAEILDTPDAAASRYPAAMVRPAGPLRWLVDQAARG